MSNTTYTLGDCRVVGQHLRSGSSDVTVAAGRRRAAMLPAFPIGFAEVGVCQATVQPTTQGFHLSTA